MADGLLNKASIILTPTGYKAGTLYNVAPVVEPYEDFDFARASVASRVNSSGLVEMVGRTLGSELVLNQDFSDWNLGAGWSVVSNKLYFDTDIGSGTASSSNILEIGKTYKITFDVNITTGVLRFESGEGDNFLIDSTYTSVTHYFVADLFALKFRRNETPTEGYITNISVKEVIDTNNIPRISYDSNGDNGHILLEPTSTNLFEYSESFNTTEWNKTNITVVDNSSQSPDGTNSASLIYPSSSGDFRYLHNSTIASSSKYTISAFVKASGKNVVWMYINSSSQNGLIYYDLSDQTTQVVSGSVGTPTATIESYNNDWYKISYTLGTGVILNGGSGLGVSDAKGDAAVTVNGTDGVLVWGLQLEALSYATSYIPTLTGSTVTRATETATGAGSADLINSTEGVLYAEIKVPQNYGSNLNVSISDSTTSEYVKFIILTTNNIRAEIQGSSNSQQRQTSFTYDVYTKIAISYNSTECKFFINGSQIGTTITTHTLPSGLNTLEFARGDGLANFYGKVKALAVFNEALSDSELTQLTT